MPLLFQYTDDSEHFLVMNLVIPLHWRQGLAVKGYQVPLLFSGQLLRKDGSGGEVRTVSLNAEGLQVLWRYQDQNSGHRHLETFEGSLLFGIPVPSLVRTREVKEGSGYSREISDKVMVEVDKA